MKHIIPTLLLLSILLAPAPSAATRGRCARARVRRDLECTCFLGFRRLVASDAVGPSGAPFTREMAIANCRAMFGPLRRLRSSCNRYRVHGKLRLRRAVRVLNVTLGRCTDRVVFPIRVA